MSCITANERPQSVIKPPTAAGQRKRTFTDSPGRAIIGQERSVRWLCLTVSE